MPLKKPAKVNLWEQPSKSEIMAQNNAKIKELQQQRKVAVAERDTKKVARIDTIIGNIGECNARIQEYLDRAKKRK